MRWTPFDTNMFAFPRMYMYLWHKCVLRTKKCQIFEMFRFRKAFRIHNWGKHTLVFTIYSLNRKVKGRFHDFNWIHIIWIRIKYLPWCKLYTPCRRCLTNSYYSFLYNIPIWKIICSSWYLIEANHLIYFNTDFFILHFKNWIN